MTDRHVAVEWHRFLGCHPVDTTHARPMLGRLGSCERIVSPLATLLNPGWDRVWPINEEALAAASPRSTTFRG